MHRKFSIKQALFMILAWWLIIYFYSYISFFSSYDYLAKSPLLDYMDSGYMHLEIFLVAFIFGLMFYLINLISENTSLRRRSITLVILIKSVKYIISLILVGYAINILFSWLGLVEEEQMQFMIENISHHFVLSMVLYFLVAILLLNGALEVSHFLGTREWFKLLAGKYHSPQTEQLIFCFIDLKGSTRIAEDLGHLQYSNFIKDCFYELSPSLQRTQARVYQYVGDEVVLYWPLKYGIKNQNCIQAYFSFVDTLHRKRHFFLEKYGLEPVFKAGMDQGVVTITEIGDFKRELAFHGDVINTAARLEKLCSKLDRSFLTTERLVARFREANHYQFESMGKKNLKGKNEEIEVYSIIKDDMPAD